MLFGERGGKYPQGNSLLVRGAEETLIVDPSLGVIPRRARLAARRPRAEQPLPRGPRRREPPVPRRALAPARGRPARAPLARRLHGDLRLRGRRRRAGWAQRAASSSSTSCRAPTRAAFRDGDVFELGGGVRVRAIHTPGHTRGHCAFRVEPDDVLYLGDIDLSSFGPYYGDAWCDLEDFERSPRPRARDRGALVRHLPPHRRARRPRGLPRAPRPLRRGDRAAARSACSRTSPSRAPSTRSRRTASSTGPRTRSPSPSPSSAAAWRSTSRGSLRQGRVREVEPGRFAAA